MSTEKKIGIMGAMHEEINGLIGLLSNRAEELLGMRTYYSGSINNIPTVVVFSRWGKVAAATIVSTLIHEYGITELIFTGVAGGINSKLRIGDIVLGERLIQHDMDARPLMEQYEIPHLKKTFFESNKNQMITATSAIKKLLESKGLHRVFDDITLAKFNIVNPELYIGDIASGDKFFADKEKKLKLHSELPSILCTEMEGAAVAQVCFEYGIPFTIIRTISDIADEKSHIDFPLFIKEISSRYSVEIIKNIYEQIQPSEQLAVSS